MHVRNAHVKSANFGVLMVVFNRHVFNQFEFYEYKMYLDVKIVALFMLLHNSKFNNFSEYCVRCHFLILSWFYNYNFIYIWWLVDISPRHVALMITDSQKCKWKNEDRGNREKKEENLDISISNHEIGFLNFLRYIVSTTLVTFKNFAIRP